MFMWSFGLLESGLLNLRQCPVLDKKNRGISPNIPDQIRETSLLAGPERAYKWTDK